MKRTCILTLFLTATLFSILPHLQAQEIGLQAKIPFDFGVGGKILPAGDYLISRQGSFLRIQNRHIDSGLFIIPEVCETAYDGEPRLLFQQLNGLYFLKSIASASPMKRVDFPTSRLEKQASEMEHRTYVADFGR